MGENLGHYVTIAHNRMSLWQLIAFVTPLHVTFLHCYTLVIKYNNCNKITELFIENVISLLLHVWRDYGCN